MKKLIIIALLLLGAIVLSSPAHQQQFKDFLQKGFQINSQIPETKEQRIVTSEESVITQVVEKSIPSVVTVSINKTTTSQDSIQFDPFSPNPFRTIPGQTQNINQNIGSGFIISKDGLIITNKHVVADTEAGYQVLTNDKKKYDVTNIYRDPLNDLAIIKIAATGLTPLTLGDSSNLKLGQLAIAIGTPLGEFTNTVTSGIVSGIGRGITAGSPYDNATERLDNVIQTDAAINPGNSGGPLINSSGQAIGVNTAVSESGQNLGFAIPINVVKELITNFNQSGGKIERPYLGIRYQMIDKQNAILNKIPQGAYVREVIKGSPAEKAGIQMGDVITSIDNQAVTDVDNSSVQKYIGSKKVGDTIKVKLYRDSKFQEVTVTLTNSAE
jgi:serine protease Do